MKEFGPGEGVPPQEGKTHERWSKQKSDIFPLLRLVLIFLLPLIFLLTTVPSGYLLEQPGPSFDLQGGLTVEGAETYPNSGEFMLTAVSLQESRLIYHFLSFFDDDYGLLKVRDYLGEELDEKKQQGVDDVWTILSQDTAVVVGLQEAGKPVGVENLGALVVSTAKDYPAYDVLKPGDVIVAVNGEPAENAAKVGEAISSTQPGEMISMRVRGINEEALKAEDKLDAQERPDTSEILGENGRTVEVHTVWDPDLNKTVIGIAMRDYFDYDSGVQVEWNMEGVKGPSAGLIMTLSLVNALTPADLTGGKKVAGTGEIFLDHRVGPIGGLPMKIRAAEGEGAEVFIYPRDNQEDLAGVSTSMKLYPVGSLQEALQVLGEIR